MYIYSHIINTIVSTKVFLGSQSSYQAMNILYRQATPKDAEDIHKMICEALRITSSKNYTDVMIIFGCSTLVCSE